LAEDVCSGMKVSDEGVIKLINILGNVPLSITLKKVFQILPINPIDSAVHFHLAMEAVVVCFLN
jgi:hypothetical protein